AVRPRSAALRADLDRRRAGRLPDPSRLRAHLVPLTADGVPPVSIPFTDRHFTRKNESMAESKPKTTSALTFTDARWKGITRPYTADDVQRLRGSVVVEHTLARLGAERLWELLHERPFVAALGALTGGQAVQQVRAGLEAIYVSGWQVAADANEAAQTYPDQSLYAADSVPALVRRINQALVRADQI